MKIKIYTFLFALLFPYPASAGSTEATEAAKILLKRGFSPAVAVSVLRASGHSSQVAESYLQKRSGKNPNDFHMIHTNIIPGDLNYHIQTGNKLLANHISHRAFARTISKCYRKGKPWRDCKIRYHQKTGCYMTKRWQKICRSYGRLPDEQRKSLIGEVCFWDPRGEVPILPSKDIKTQINLKGAKRKRVRRHIGRGNFLKRPLCSESDNRLFPGRGIETYNPKQNGKPIHWCLTPLKGCGYPAAKVFCKSKGFKNVTYIFRERNANFAVHLGTGQTCSNGDCTIFTHINCDQPMRRR